MQQETATCQCTSSHASAPALRTLLPSPLCIRDRSWATLAAAGAIELCAQATTAQPGPVAQAAPGRKLPRSCRPSWAATSRPSAQLS